MLPTGSVQAQVARDLEVLREPAVERRLGVLGQVVEGKPLAAPELDRLAGLERADGRFLLLVEPAEVHAVVLDREGAQLALGARVDRADHLVVLAGELAVELRVAVLESKVSCHV